MQPSVSSTDSATFPEWESIVVAFESAWDRGVIPDINQALQSYTGRERTALLHELVLVDMENRWRTIEGTLSIVDELGCRPRLCDYARRCSDLESVEELPVHVIAEEYRIRKICGDGPTWDQFLSQQDRHISRLIPLLVKIDAELAVDSASTPVTAREIVVEADPAAPLRYADYTLQRLLGAGGMGRVYAALRRLDHRIVAVKALRKSLQRNPRAVRQFVQEAQLLSQLDHPRIIRVHGLGQFPRGGYFIVMDCIDGDNLQKRLDIGPFPVSEAVRIVRTVAEAIQHAHLLGILHCDLKPANILLDHSGQPTVTDFGFAQLISDRLPAEQTIGGTYGYIAPEILAEGAKQIGTAVDIYGLGALLVALLTGWPPSAGPQLDNQLNGIPEQIIRTCHRCLAKAPGDRFSNPTEMIASLGSRK